MQGRGPVFDQRHQKVQYQWNAAGDINFGAAESREQIASQIGKLGIEVRKAAEAGVLDEEQATEAEYNLKRACLVAAKPEGSKADVTKYLSTAKDVVKDISALGSLVTAISEAVQKVGNFF